MQPWVDHATPDHTKQSNLLHNVTGRPSLDPIADYTEQIMAALGDLLVIGLQRADDHTAAQWQRLAADGAGRGFVRLSNAVKAVADSLMRKIHVLDWDWLATAHVALDLALLTRFALEQ